MKKVYISKEEAKYVGQITLLSLALNLIIEVLNEDSIVTTMKDLIHNPIIFLYNALIILVTLSISLLVKRRILTLFSISALWLGFGITNNVLLNFRTTPFTAVDISLMSEAIPIADKYLTPASMVLIAVGVVALIITIAIVFIKAPKHKGSISYLRNAIFVVVLCLTTFLCTDIGVKAQALAKNFGNIAIAYKEYGFAYCFMNSLINTGISKPDNYSKEAVKQVINVANDTTKEKEIKETTKKTPNIIFLQLESFFDPSHITDFSFSSDPIPTFHKLKDNYTSGFLNVPSVGAGTANTEFEIISGMNLDFFGPGEYPYKTILKQTTCESMAYNLKELGYRTHTIHNNDATFYGRNTVFPNLGFDTFTPLEFMQNVTFTPTGWAKDDVLIEQIMNCLDSTNQRDYIYTISVQGHGKYPKDLNSLYQSSSSQSSAYSQGLEEKEMSQDNKVQLSNHMSEHTITMEGIEKERKFAFEYFVNEIHEMDHFVANLIDTLESTGEDTILVLYGDHLPSLNIENEDLANKNIYQTEYIVWSSKGLFDQQYDKDLEAYQLSSYVLQLCNISNGLLNKMHQREFSQPSDHYLDELQLLQYDMLYGKQDAYNGTNPYIATDLQLGVKPLEVTSVTTDGQNTVIKGLNFTPYSKVEVNGEVVPTTFVDGTTLRLEQTSLSTGTKVFALILDDNTIELGRSNEYIVTN